jgi:hypothetical protein
MRLSSVFGARAVWYLDIEALNPRGIRLFPDVIPALVSEFHFSEYPKSTEQMDETASSGIAFRNGKFDGPKGPVAADFEIHAAGLAVQTKASTQESEHILGDLVQWGVKNYGLSFEPSMIRKKLYVSQLVFHVDKDISKGLGKIEDFSRVLSESEIGGKIQPVEPTAVLFRADGNERNAFTFERRVPSPFSENKYYSLADVPTDVHMDLIQRFEDLLSS